MNQNHEADPWFLALCEAMESAIGRGWKRQLADKVGVSESNVQVWLKSGRVPAAVRRALELCDEVESLREELHAHKRLTCSRWITEESLHGEVRYSIQELDTESGRARLIATGIVNLEDAQAIAGIPQVKSLIRQAFDQFQLEEQFNDDEKDKELLASLENWPGLTAWEKKTNLEKHLSDAGEKSGLLKAAKSLEENSQ